MHHKLTLCAVLALLTCAATAGQVYDRSVVVTDASTGIGTVTPPAAYAGIELKKIWIEGAAAAATTATVYRVIGDGVYTQAVATVGTGAGTSGSAVPAQYAAIKSGESFYVVAKVGTAGTNAVVILDVEIQRHD